MKEDICFTLCNLGIACDGKQPFSVIIEVLVCVYFLYILVIFNYFVN